MKVLWYKVSVKNGKKTKKMRNITKIVSSVEWSGSDTQVCRTLAVEIAYDPYGPKNSSVRPSIGDIIVLKSDKNKTLFYGQVTSTDKTSEIGTITFNCKDYMDHLLRTKLSIKFRNKTAEHIAKRMAKKAGLKVGTLKKTKKKLKKLFATETEAYSIMMKAYKMASRKTGDRYIPYMDGTKVCVRERGQIVGETTHYTIRGGYNLLTATKSRDTDSMVNRVVIYGANGKKLGTVQNKGKIQKYGVFQEALTLTETKKKKLKKAIKKGKKEARKKLHGASTTMQIEALGDTRCVSGAGVRIQDKLSGITGLFYIKSDSHKWENGNHTMTLDLKFKNTMENPQVNYNDSKKEKKQFKWPCKKSPIVHGFGSKKSAEGSGSHKGIDIKCGSGAKVKASAAGKVTARGKVDKLGKRIIITHSNGYKTVYGHLKSFSVKSGQKVKAGQVIGYCGDSALHFGVQKGKKWTNPKSFLS